MSNTINSYKSFYNKIKEEHELFNDSIIEYSFANFEQKESKQDLLKNKIEKQMKALQESISYYYGALIYELRPEDEKYNKKICQKIEKSFDRIDKVKELILVDTPKVSKKIKRVKDEQPTRTKKKKRNRPITKSRVEKAVRRHPAIKEIFSSEEFTEKEKNSLEKSLRALFGKADSQEKQQKYTDPKTWFELVELIEYSRSLQRSYQIAPTRVFNLEQEEDVNLKQILNHIERYRSGKRHSEVVPLTFAPSKNHWTLGVIDFNLERVEYYDSFVNYGNKDEIDSILNQVAENYGFEKKDMVTQNLQSNSYDCGVWHSYFLKNKIDNPFFDPSHLNKDEMEQVIRDFRIEVLAQVAIERSKD